jgi:hypothetical protein
MELEIKIKCNVVMNVTGVIAITSVIKSVRIFIGILKGRDNWEDVDVDGRVILKWFLGS